MGEAFLGSQAHDSLVENDMQVQVVEYDNRYQLDVSAQFQTMPRFAQLWCR